MTLHDNTFNQHQLERWTRPDAHHFVRADWRQGVLATSNLAAVFDLYERKYREDQLRDHGRFAYEGRDKVRKIRIAARISASQREACEIQLRKDEFICKSVQRRSCYAQAMLRYANCLQGLPIPPLFF